MHRVDPSGVCLRALEIRTIHRRRYQVPGPLALWDIDRNHKLIRFGLWYWLFDIYKYYFDIYRCTNSLISWI